MKVGTRATITLAVLTLVAASCGPSLRGTNVRPANELRRPLAPATFLSTKGIHKIRHVIIVMQENRSFDSYFGTFPGANGIPMRDGVPTVCVPDPQLGHCVRPYQTPPR